jgi:hypothetical protein
MGADAVVLPGFGGVQALNRRWPNPWEVANAQAKAEKAAAEKAAADAKVIILENITHWPCLVGKTKEV